MKALRHFITPISCFVGLMFAALIQDLTSGPARYSMWQWMPVYLIGLSIPTFIVLVWSLIQKPRPSPGIGFLAGASSYAAVELLDQFLNLPDSVIAGLICFLPLLMLIVYSVIRGRSSAEGRHK